MNVLQTNAFSKAIKKRHANQKKDLDAAIHTIIANPTIGDRKKGDLAGVYVHKFKMVGQFTLLAYSYHDQVLILTLLALGSHENFHRDFKN